MLATILHIIKKEAILEARQKNTLYGITLYAVILAFLIYMLLPDPEPLVWNALIWLSVLFITINTVAKSFLQESKARWAYYYTIYNPVQLMLAKIIYNAALMLAMACINLLLFSFFLTFPALNKMLFTVVFLLGSVSFSILFTFLSSLVAKTKGGPALLAIIGLPLVLPLILLVTDLSISTLQPMLVVGWNKFFIGLIGLDFLIVALALILYPYVWKD
jgi:heme exporter protein B